VIYDRPKLEV